jgi:hypothetical protein
MKKYLIIIALLLIITLLCSCSKEDEIKQLEKITKKNEEIKDLKIKILEKDHDITQLQSDLKYQKKQNKELKELTATATPTERPETPTPTIKPIITVAPGKKPKIVTLISALMIENNSVGNDWSYTVKINGKILNIGDRLKITDKVITANITVIEADSRPDEGFKNENLKIGVNEFDVLVTENMGRYSGNTSKWHFKIEVK